MQAARLRGRVALPLQTRRAHQQAGAPLAIYALALTIRVPGLKLFDIKCAWFNEEEYNGFFPRTLFAKR